MTHMGGITGYLSKRRRKDEVANYDEAGTDTIDKKAWQQYPSSGGWIDVVTHLHELNENATI
jgi:hypothetical protein